MNDIRKIILKKFEKKNRYANFGSCINHMNVHGFRGVYCEIAFESPITAITGLNGAGKSTIGQIMLCGYKKNGASSYKRWYVKDFFPTSILDPSPFDKDAYIEYTYQTDDYKRDQTLTVKRAKKEWSGYKRQPEKASIYIGLAFYLPKVERKDLTIYSSREIEMADRYDIDGAAHWASRILGNNYDEVFFQEVRNNKRSAELGIARRRGNIYSENNMGFGEGRVIHSIRLLENCPEKSLIVLEEPETSLHENAQYEFTQYLMDVCKRRGHQIFFSTHSSLMIEALPPEGRKFLDRNDKETKVYNNISSIEVRNALSDGREGKLIICVEDEFSKLFLTEIIRKHDKELLKITSIKEFGDIKAVKNAVKVLSNSNVISIGVLDGDAKGDGEKILSLPGECAPEKEIFFNKDVKNFLISEYEFNLDHFINKYPSTDHHKIPHIISKETYIPLESIIIECIRIYIYKSDNHMGKDIVNKIREVINNSK